MLIQTKGAAPAVAPRPARGSKQFIVADFQVKEADTKARTFSGALSTSHLDLGNGFQRDITMPGAFKRTLANFKRAKGGGYIPLVDSHSYFSIMNVFGHLIDGAEVLTGKTLSYKLAGGKTLDVPEMELQTEWQVIDGADGERFMDRLRPRSVRKMSMGYTPIKSEDVTMEPEGPARLLREVMLNEGSMVVFGMNPNAEVDPSTVKALLDSLRDGTLDPDTIEDIKALSPELRAELLALLQPEAPAPAASEPAAPADPPVVAGLAADDPKRLLMEQTYRELNLQALTLLAR